jgi:BirA family transcriptional regulator, biotin operon repressor / biotin---[acetyl-CoA-carboxylase] ligase
MVMTPLSFAVLRQLADGRFRSGTELARVLGVSRGTVWNAVHAIEAADLTVYKVRGRGYRLARSVSLLDPARIATHTGAFASRLSVEVVDCADSTNSLLMQRAAAGAPSGAVLAAEWQHNGRGRLGRVWHSGLAGALTFSVLWRFEHGASALGGLSLAAGLALARAVAKLGVREVALKWPNDVLWRGRKLAGILIEMRGDQLGPSAVVIGIGVNVMLSGGLAARIGEPAASLEEAVGELDRNRALGAVLAELVLVLDAYAQAGFEPLRGEWERWHAHQDRAVNVLFPDGRRETGRARGVGADGALLLETAHGARRLLSGEVTLRAAAGTAPGEAAPDLQRQT